MISYNNQTLLVTNFDEKIRNSTIHRETSNKPELRQTLIFDILKKKYAHMRPGMNLTNEIINNLGIHSTEYLSFLEHAYNSWTQTNDRDFFKMGGLMPYHFTRRKPYQRYQELPYWKQTGYFCDDVITPIYEDTYQIAMESANNCYVASNLILDDQYKIIYCLNTYPGHHAMYDGYGGYCFINNAALAAANLTQLGKKVAILDLDYHAGNGTFDIFYKGESTTAISIHADPRYEYPSFSGFEEETLGSNMNIIFPKKARWSDYEKCLKKALEHINKLSIDIIIIAFGADTYIKDPDPSILYGCCLEIEDYKKMGQLIANENTDKKFIVTQEGGYSINDVPLIVEALLEGLNS